MKIFILKIISLFLIVFGLNYVVIYNLTADKPIDEFYSKVSSPKQKYMILGTSRAAQALDPNIIFGNKGLNFAFTMANSPYGETYFHAIKNKLSDETDGYFIVEVSPLAISINESSDTLFPEKNYFLENLFSFSNQPNLAYLYLKFKKPLYSLFISKKGILNPQLNGRLIINKPAVSEVNPIIESKLKAYQKIFSKSSFSNLRFKQLVKTIILLKKHGEVIIVRLPVSKKMLELEQIFDPNFNDRMYNLSKEYEIDFKDYSELSGKLLTIDGNHLCKKAGDLISLKIRIDSKIDLE